jgi:hypothetical protein
MANKKASTPYIEQLHLRVGEMVINTITGIVGQVKRAITSKRYMVDFGKGPERMSYKDLQRPVAQPVRNR